MIINYNNKFNGMHMGPHISRQEITMKGDSADRQTDRHTSLEAAQSYYITFLPKTDTKIRTN